MLIAIVGGKLQGVEAVYLSKKAGWETILIDKNADAPATGLCDRFLQFQFSRETPIPPDFPAVDFILPAIEDEEVLIAVDHWAKTCKIPLAFDLVAYFVSSSKHKSDTLFKNMSLPGPKPWPDCNFPVVVKPDQASGSQGVQIFHDPAIFSSTFLQSSIPDDLIAQEFMAGDLYSIEVIGSSGNYSALQVTDLEMDDDYDCKRVTAPTKLSSELVKKFEKMAIDIAEELTLTGIMDVEVILHENELKILEIDARLPSQTPMAVYKSTGINMVEMLGNLVLQKTREKTENKNSRFVSIEHIQVSRDALTVLGEHIMAVKNPLTMMADFFGADECITNYSSGKNQSFEHQLYKDTDMWVATMIFSSDSREALAIKRENCYKQILAFHNDN